MRSIDWLALLVCRVELFLLQFLDMALFQDPHQGAFNRIRLERFRFQGHQHAVLAEQRWPHGFDVKVRGALIDHDFQQIVQLAQ